MEFSMPIVTSVATVLVALATFILAWATNKLVKATNIMAAATDAAETRAKMPRISVKADIHAIHGSIAILVIANTGYGTAYNVNVRLERDPDDFERHNVIWKLEEWNYGFIMAGEMRTCPFGNGFQFVDDCQGSRLKPFKVHVDYKDFEGKIMETIAIDIDLLDMFGMFRDMNSPELKSANALEKISQELSNLTKSKK